MLLTFVEERILNINKTWIKTNIKYYFYLIQHAFLSYRIKDCSTKCLCAKYQHKKALLSFIFDFLFFLHSAQIYDGYTVLY